MGRKLGRNCLVSYVREVKQIIRIFCCSDIIPNDNVPEMYADEGRAKRDAPLYLWNGENHNSYPYFLGLRFWYKPPSCFLTSFSFWAVTCSPKFAKCKNHAKKPWSFQHGEKTQSQSMKTLPQQNEFTHFMWVMTLQKKSHWS